MEEKKTYSIVGKVEIGTDEYRELIEGRMSAEKELSDYRSRYWREEEKVKKLEKELEDIKAYKVKLMDFIKQDNERYQAYVRFTAEKSIEVE
jgi:hypothetical protein